MSDFCRGPLSPVPSSGSRRRRRPLFDHSDDDAEEEGSGSNNTFGEVDDDLPSIRSEEEEEASCLVRLLSWNRSSSESSSACTKIPLNVLKELSLRDGDCAFLEKHFVIDDETDKNNDIDIETLLTKVVVRLQLMDEDEEEGKQLGVVATIDDDCNNNVCLVPSIVLANLGIPPQTIWQQQNSTDGSIPMTEQNNGVVVFRLRAIHEKNTGGDSSRSGDQGDDELETTPPWQISRDKNSTLPARGKVASHVLLRPLGRAPLWPWFSLTPPVTTATKATIQNETQGEGKKPEDRVDSSTNHLAFEKSKTTQTTIPTADVPIEPKKDDNQVKDGVWIYPSRSGVILQESTLCEVRYNSNNSCNLYKSVCYYEVLQIVTRENDGNEEGKGKSVCEDDFYVTAPCTQFELDSCPLSALSHVRRLPLPPPFSASSLECGDSSKSTTTVLEDKTQRQPIQSPREQSNSPLVTPRKFFESSNNGGAFADETTSEEPVFSCHPDWRKVANALLEAPLMGSNVRSNNNNTSNAVNDSRILHLVGTDADHDLQACVTTAASMVGMQCLSIKGLAAFGYEHRRSKKRDIRNGNNNGNGVTVRSSMIEQQLAGIDASLEYIVSRRMEPCVLHLSGMDEELASVSNDDQLRFQIEDRFWSKWSEGVATATETETISRRTGNEDPSQLGGRNYNRGLEIVMADRLDYCYTPRILIVISTKTSLKGGPWLERLIFPSISLSLPDDNYIDFLWNNSRITKGDRDAMLISNEKSQESSVVLTEEMMPLLRGRPVREIIQLKGDIMIMDNRDNNSNSNSNDDGEIDLPSKGSYDYLKKLCDNFDAGRRNASSDVARISGVTWEDVGGLDHVRAEILDAIELPLKHPHLFPPNTGRSGILLFGPPGTGKTLVAKAVATECGLPFLSVKGPELLGSYIGESEANIRKVFASARLAAENNLPVQASILFFDELDSLAPKRGGNSNHGGGVMERVVASLLSELDGGGKDDCGRVFVLGATNRPDLLDSSLLRPGRLDRLVYLGIPSDDNERARVLASQLRKMKLEGDALQMARSVIEEGLPPRLSGADMSKLSSGAMLHAIRRLCVEADRERENLLQQQQHQQQGGDNARGVTIDEILESWGEEKCTPVITLDDLRLASNDVSSSVSDEEMQRYDRLRKEHETRSSSVTR